MVDIATIKDPTTPEEHKKRMEDVRMKEIEKRKAAVTDNISTVLGEITNSNKAEQRLRSIEEKLDLILKTLEERR